MPPEPQGVFSVIWVIFSFSFLVALTGAMAPGPLLTYTIIKSASAERHGYLMGLWVILGHAILEVGIILCLLLGFSVVLKNIVVVRIIGVAGGLILVYLGGAIVRNVIRGNIPTEFMDSKQADGKKASPGGRRNKLENPVLGGIMVSMSNPYWWVWWATIGFAFMLQFEVSFEKWPRLLAFFIGHEAGDLAWYLLVSILSFFGLRRRNKKAYYGVLAVCGLFMVFFGVYLGLSPIISGIDLGN